MDEATARARLDRVFGAGVPADALAFYGRWWQLETWLREVAYVELRTKFGSSWTTHLAGNAPKRAAGDRANAYMASADSGELLAYADVSSLFALVDDNWDLFAPLLPPQRRWQGTTDELSELRNRNAHCRRPHKDDLARIEQMLRDVEPGAWLFYSSYQRTMPVPSGGDDPLSTAWIEGEHETASRLLGHAERQYGTRFRLEYSRRPWAARRAGTVVPGTAGLLWHAKWTISDRDLNIAELWADLSRGSSHRDLIVHLLIDPGHVTATFAAVDDPAKIADAIGELFDALLTTSFPSPATGTAEEWSDRWTRGADGLPGRVQTSSVLTLVDPHRPDAFSIFSAEN